MYFELNLALRSLDPYDSRLLSFLSIFLLMIKPLPLYDGHLIGPGLVLYFRMLMFSVRTLSNEAHKPRGCRGRRSSLTTWPRLPVRYKAFTFQQDISVPSFGFKQSTVGVSAPRRVWLTSVICPFSWLVSSSSSPMIVSGTSVSARMHFFFTGWGCWPQAQFPSFTRAWERLDIPILDWIYPGRVIMGLAITISLQLNSALSVRSIQVIKESALRLSNRQILWSQNTDGD